MTGERSSAVRNPPGDSRDPRQHRDGVRLLGEPAADGARLTVLPQAFVALYPSVPSPEEKPPPTRSSLSHPGEDEC
jgi:hypothetical protein